MVTLRHCIWLLVSWDRIGLWSSSRALSDPCKLILSLNMINVSRSGILYLYLYTDSSLQVSFKKYFRVHRRTGYQQGCKVHLMVIYGRQTGCGWAYTHSGSLALASVANAMLNNYGTQLRLAANQWFQIFMLLIISTLNHHCNKNNS